MHNRRFRQFKIILRNPFRLPIGNITPATSPARTSRAETWRAQLDCRSVKP
jgi:hypothetical protein